MAIASYAEQTCLRNEDSARQFCPVSTAAYLRPATGPCGYNADVTLRCRITDAAEKFRKSGGHPQQVHLTKADAMQLQYELLAEGGQIARDIMRDGVQKAVQNIVGLKIVWGSPLFDVV
jgi:hypothetical protein